MSNHECQDRQGFELSLVAYPHGIFRCSECHQVTRTVPIDDMCPDDALFAYEIIQCYRKARGKA